MEKLEKLSVEQEKIMYETRDFWLDMIFSCKTEINKRKAIEGVNFIYEESGLQKPHVIFVDSPMACQQAANQILGNKKMEFIEFSNYGNISDYSWVSFYDFFSRIGIVENEKFNKFKDFILSGIYDCVQLEGYCIVSSLPIKILRNEENILHSVNESSIKFRDGYEQFYVNGVNLSRNVFEKLLKREYEVIDFISERSEEVKAACLAFMKEKFGEQSVVNFFAENLKEVDSFVDIKNEKYLQGTTRGQTVGVYTLFKGNLSDVELTYVRCYCPSTDRMFYLCVDNEQTNAKDAIASLYRVPECLKPHILEIRRQGERFSTTFDKAGNEKLRKLSEEDSKRLTTITGSEYFSKMTFEY